MKNKQSILMVAVLLCACAAAVAGGLYRVKLESSAAADGVTCTALADLNSGSSDGVLGGYVNDVCVYGGVDAMTCTVSRVSIEGPLTNTIVTVVVLGANVPVFSNLCGTVAIASGDKIFVTSGLTNAPFNAQIVISPPER